MRRRGLVAVTPGDTTVTRAAGGREAPAVLRAENVSYSYGDRPVLRDVSIQVRGGETVGIIGPNGSGKTTLLRTLYRSLNPDSGTVTLDGRPLGEYRSGELARHIAVVVQEFASDLPLTVADSVMLGRTPHLGLFHTHSRQDDAIVAQALHRVGAQHLASHEFAALSGGEKQRVMIARALSQEADYLLMDEPTNHLDVHYQHEVLRLIHGLDLSTAVVLHDLNLAARYCDRLILLDRGRVRATGTPDQVLVPELLAPIYGVHFERTRADDGGLQLLHRCLAVTDVEPHAQPARRYREHAS